MTYRGINNGSMNMDNLEIIIDGRRHHVRPEFNDYTVGWRLAERGCELPDSASDEMAQGYFEQFDSVEAVYASA